MNIDHLKAALQKQASMKRRSWIAALLGDVPSSDLSEHNGWLRMSIRKRSLCRIAIGPLLVVTGTFLVYAFGKIISLLGANLDSDFDSAHDPRRWILFPAGIPLFLGVMLVIIGLQGLVTGTPWQNLPAWIRFPILVLGGILGFILIFYSILLLVAVQEWAVQV